MRCRIAKLISASTIAVVLLTADRSTSRPFSPLGAEDQAIAGHLPGQQEA